jgi:hypothetical protein
MGNFKEHKLYLRREKNKISTNPAKDACQRRHVDSELVPVPDVKCAYKQRLWNCTKNLGLE